MQKIKSEISNSVQEMKQTRSLVIMSLLLALGVVIGCFSIQLTESIKINVSFLTDELTGAMFGPVCGAVSGGLADLLKYVIHPTGPYFPGFTLSEALTAMIYGWFLHKDVLTLKRIIFANTTVTVFINLILNTLWLYLLYGNSVIAALPFRIIKEAVMLPINIILFYGLQDVLKRSGRFK